MRIWLINHYAVPPRYYPLARQNYFAKYLMRAGHEVTIFAASTVHNSDLNLIEDDTPYREDVVDGVHYVLIRCKSYHGNGVSRILNMLEFARKLPGVCNKYPRPDAIVATSMPPMSCAAGIKLARKYGCRGIAEIADLWPESIVAYGIAGPRNPAVLYLRRLEKWIYTKSDAVVFTMEGAYDYIKEQHWESAVPRSKVHYINNGVDLELFDYNRENCRLEDADLVITGEGKIDSQSLRGKVVIGVARRASKQKVPVCAVVGDVADDAYDAYDMGVSAIFSTNRLAITFSQAKLRSEQDYRHTLEDILRMIKVCETMKS